MTPEPLNPSLQLAIAKELPEHIWIKQWDSKLFGGEQTRLLWKSGHTITDREWDYIMLRLIEPRLSPAESMVYAEMLCKTTKGDMLDWSYYYGDASIDWLATFNIANATFNQRAAAWCELKGIKYQ